MKKAKCFILTLILLYGTVVASAQEDTDFRTKWELPPGATTSVSSISFNALTDGPVSYSIDNGDPFPVSGSFTQLSPGNVTIDLSSNPLAPGETYKISFVHTNLRRFFYGRSAWCYHQQFTFNRCR